MLRNEPCAYRSEGFPRTGLLHPWARWGRGLVAGNSSVSSSRDGAGGGDGVGMRGDAPEEQAK